MTPPPRPPTSPARNPVENIWQDMPDNGPSHRIFQSSQDILDPCCHAWNNLVDRPRAIMPIGLRARAHRS